MGAGSVGAMGVWLGAGAVEEGCAACEPSAVDDASGEGAGCSGSCPRSVSPRVPQHKTTHVSAIDALGCKGFDMGSERFEVSDQLIQLLGLQSLPFAMPLVASAVAEASVEGGCAAVVHQRRPVSHPS